MSSINKQGQSITNTFAEYIEYEGAFWVPLLIHNVNNGSSLFTSSDGFSKMVYKDSLRWCDFELIGTETRPESSYYEFLLILEEGSDRVVNKYRWKLTVSPLTATWADVNPSVVGSKVIRVSSTKTNNYAGMYKLNNNVYMCFANDSNGNWYGCAPYALWGGTAGTNGYIPGYNRVLVYGLQMLYMRVSTPIHKIYNNVMDSNNLIEY